MGGRVSSGTKDGAEVHVGSPCPSKHKNFMRHHPPPTPQHTHRPDYLTGSQAEQETKILPGQRECREPWTLRVSRADSISPLHGSAQQFPQLCLPPLQNRPVRSTLGHRVAGGRIALGSCCLLVSWGSLLSSLLFRSCKATPERHTSPPAHKAAVSLGSFCGLGLLFLSTAVRKPLPQKVSSGGLVYRGDALRAPGESQPTPRYKEWRHQPGLPFQLLGALRQALHLSMTRHHERVCTV